jgi:hypothetical protein
MTSGCVRAWLVVAVIVVCGACDKPEVPTEEYAAAMKAYEATTLQTLGSTGADPRWQEVIALLRTVPQSNKTEHRKAKNLADTIEAEQQKLVAIQQRGGAAADALLRAAAERRPTSTGPMHHGPPVGGASRGATGAANRGGTVSSTGGASATCAADCRAQEERCYSTSDCKKVGGTWQCADDSVSRSGWCHQQARTCFSSCSGAAAPPSGAACRQSCDLQANGCYLAVPGCVGSDTNWTCPPESKARGTWCGTQLATCRQGCG